MKRRLEGEAMSSEKFKVGDRVTIKRGCSCIDDGRTVFDLVNLDYRGACRLRIPKYGDVPFDASEIEHAPAAAGGPEEADLVTWTSDVLGLAWRPVVRGLLYASVYLNQADVHDDDLATHLVRLVRGGT